MNSFSSTDCRKVTVALISEYDVILITSLNAGGNSRSTAVCRLNPIAVKVIVCEYATSYRSNADCSACYTKLIESFRYKAVNNTVCTTGAIMECVFCKCVWFFKYYQ